MSYTTKFRGILIFVHLKSSSSCSAPEIKTSHGTHIQDLKMDFRCHGHDLRSTNNSQTLFRTKFSNITIDKLSKRSHLNPEIKFGPIIFLH